MAFWLIIRVLRRHCMVSRVKCCCVAVLAVVLWHASQALVTRCHFVADRSGAWTVGVGSMMLTLVMRGSNPGVMACVLHLWVCLVVFSFLCAVGLFANAVTSGVLTLWRMGDKDFSLGHVQSGFARCGDWRNWVSHPGWEDLQPAFWLCHRWWRCPWYFWALIILGGRSVIQVDFKRI